MTSEVIERVSRGTALLDERRPGWYRDIDTETLSIASGRRCICGQLYGDYGTGVNLLGVMSDSHLYGFNGGSTASIDDLDAEWKRVIAERVESEARELVLV